MIWQFPDIAPILRLKNLKHHSVYLDDLRTPYFGFACANEV